MNLTDALKLLGKAVAAYKGRKIASTSKRDSFVTGPMDAQHF